MKNIKAILSITAATLVLASCLEQEALEIQGAQTKSDEYYASLREWKKSPHVLSFGFYTSWHKLEGSYGEYESPASYGQRLLALPDSMDIVDLWMGIPSNDPLDPDYSPRSWKEMKYLQETMGTRFVFHADASHNQIFKWAGTFADGTEIKDSLWFDVLGGKGTIAAGHGLSESDPVGGGLSSTQSKNDACRAYAHWLLDKMIKSEMDGIDIDYEPNDATWNENTMKLVCAELGNYIGPAAKGKDKEIKGDKLLIINFFGGNPGPGVKEYIDYLVNQCYAWQIGTSVSGWVGRKPSWCDADKFILNDSLGGELDNRYTGGSSLGGMPMSYNGVEMYSLEAMARTVKDNGFAGFGAYYMDRNYISASGIPFNEFRRAIQIANGNIE